MFRSINCCCIRHVFLFWCFSINGVTNSLTHYKSKKKVCVVGIVKYLCTIGDTLITQHVAQSIGQQ